MADKNDAREFFNFYESKYSSPNWDSNIEQEVIDMLTDYATNREERWRIAISRAVEAHEGSTWEPDEVGEMLRDAITTAKERSDLLDKANEEIAVLKHALRLFSESEVKEHTCFYDPAHMDKEANLMVEFWIKEAKENNAEGR